MVFTLTDDSVRGLECHNLRANTLQNSAEVVHYLVIGNAHDGVAVGFEMFCSGFIAFALICMNGAVYFNNQLAGRSIEIENGPSHRMLPTKPDAKLPTAQCLP